MGRRKKEEKPIQEVFVDEPSNTFCSKCKNRDIRVLQDNLNLAVITINLITEELGIDNGSFERKCKGVRQWVNEQKKKRKKVEKKILKKK